MALTRRKLWPRVGFAALLLAGAGFALLTQIAGATEYTWTNFKVLDPVISIFGGLSTSTNFSQIESGGQAAIGLATSANFILQGGFLYFPGLPSPSPSASPTPSAAPRAGVGGFITGLVKIFRPAPPGFDLNRDGKIDLVDVSIMLYWWEKRITASQTAAIIAAGRPSPDFNDDGKVDIFDLSMLLYYWSD